MMKSPNERLNKLVADWRANGCPDQEAFPWIQSRTPWLQLAQEFNVDTRQFPQFIDREFLWNISISSAGFRSAFLAVMIWGYGDVGYGPHRVRQMFASEGFDETLRTVKAMCDAGQALAAYKNLRDSRIRQLGPSFSSKVLTFFHQPESAPAILDSVIAKWLNKNAPGALGIERVSTDSWSLSTYQRYVEWMDCTASKYGLPASSLEYLVFQDEYGS